MLCEHFNTLVTKEMRITIPAKDRNYYGFGRKTYSPVDIN